MFRIEGLGFRMFLGLTLNSQGLARAFAEVLARASALRKTLRASGL